MVAKFIELSHTHGFDKDTRPPWQMVGVLRTKSAVLQDGIGWNIFPDDPSIATIVPNTASTPHGPTFQDFDINGVNRGITMILGEPPGGLPPLRLLEVEVKETRWLKIAFQCVTDSSFNSPLQWAQATGFMRQLRFNTGNMFDQQANLSFDVLRVKDVKAGTSLRDIIGRQDRHDLAATRHLRGPYREWEKLTAEGDPGAEINVFFVPRSTLRKENSLSPLVFGLDGSILCEDDPFRRIGKLERELAQVIAEMLGVSRMTGSSHPEYLMSQSSDVTARKLLKDHANILNPTLPI